MKVYQAPSVNMLLFDSMDVLTESSFGSADSGFGERIDIGSYFQDEIQ